MPWYWVQEGVPKGTCMKVWDYGMAPFGRGHQPEPTTKRTGHGDGTAMTPSGHSWDCMTETFQYNPNTWAQESGLRQELAACNHQIAFFHHVGKEPKRAREHEFEAGPAEAGNKTSWTQASPVSPSRGFVRQQFSFEANPISGISPHPPVATAVSCLSFYTRKWKHTEKRLKVTANSARTKTQPKPTQARHYRVS